MILKIGRRSTHEVADAVEASRVFSAERDASGEGASTFPDGKVTDKGRFVARISYNGRIWSE